MTRTAEDIDAILAADKQMAGQPRWQESDRDTVAGLRVQLVVEGIIRTDVYLAGNAVVHLSPQPVSLILVCGGRPVERLDLFPRAPHTNPPGGRVPRPLRGLILPAGQHQHHAWRLNRTFPPNWNLPVAEPWSVLDSVAVAFQSFLAALNIVGDLPLPPHEPRLVP
jgi:hypothetical protein